MFTKRIIPCLDVHNGRVVKGVNFVNLRDAGDPVEIAAAYDKAGADELVFLDITASSDARETVVDMVRRVAETVFIPFTVGGGIRTVEDFRRLLREGADKISINSSAINTPQLISDAADKFGRQCVVVAIDARRREDGSGWNVYKNGGRIDNLTQEQRTNLALRFCGKIKKAGYDPMIYGNMTWLYQNYDFEKISKYPIWLASYSSDCPMEDKFEMWQYSNIGQVNGIEGDVDINIYLQKK